MRPPTTKPRTPRLRKHAWHISAVLAVLPISLLFGAGVIGLWLQKPALMSSVNATSEIVENIADGSDAGAIRLSRAVLYFDGEEAKGCDSRLFVPAEGARETIVRGYNQPLVVRILPNADGKIGRFVPTKESQSSPKEMRIVYDHHVTRCGAPDFLRIPISGTVVLGDDFSAQTSDEDAVYTLYSGRIDTFARSNTQLLGIPIPGTEEVLYPIGSITLPSGARLRECPDAGKNPAKPANWSGYAEARLDSSDVTDRFLLIALFTDAHRFALSSPGGEKVGGRICGNGQGGRGAREDVLSTSILARIIGDPYLAAIGTAVGFVLLLVQTLIAMFSLPNRE